MVNTLIQNYEPMFAVVSYHVNPPSGGSDPYDTPWGNDRGTTFYNIWGDGIPWFAYDGLFDAWPISNYQPALISRLAEPTDVTMSVSASSQSWETWDVTVEVCVEPGGTGKDLRIYLVQVLDGYPTVPAYSRNTFMQAADTADVTLAAGECTDVLRTLTFDATSMLQPADIEVVAWAQDPLGGIPAPVHQAAKYRPFLVLGDGFESGDTSGWTITVP